MNEVSRCKKAHGITPSQTVGPFFAYCLTPEAYGGNELASPSLCTEQSLGSKVMIEGAVFDGDMQGVPDAMLEIWQADCTGRLNISDQTANTDFRGFGRVETKPDGSFAFMTVKPGRLPGPDGSLQAPYVNVAIFGKGLLRQLFTRIYFADEQSNESDPILAMVPRERRSSLMAIPNVSKRQCYRFDIVLQGTNETVFFEA